MVYPAAAAKQVEASILHTTPSLFLRGSLHIHSGTLCWLVLVRCGRCFAGLKGQEMWAPPIRRLEGALHGPLRRARDAGSSLCACRSGAPGVSAAGTQNCNLQGKGAARQQPPRKSSVHLQVSSKSSVHLFLV